MELHVVCQNQVLVLVENLVLDQEQIVFLFMRDVVDDPVPTRGNINLQTILDFLEPAGLPDLANSALDNIGIGLAINLVYADKHKLLHHIEFSVDSRYNLRLDVEEEKVLWFSDVNSALDDWLKAHENEIAVGDELGCE